MFSWLLSFAYLRPCEPSEGLHRHPAAESFENWTGPVGRERPLPGNRGDNCGGERSFVAGDNCASL